MTGEYDSEREMGRLFVTQPDAVVLTYLLARTPTRGGVEAHPSLRDSVTLLIQEATGSDAPKDQFVQKFEGPEVDELTRALIEARRAAVPRVDDNLIGNINAYLGHIPEPVVARCGGLALA